MRATTRHTEIKVGICLFAAAGLLVLMVYWKPLVAWADKNEKMASWVQAVGSVAAILLTAGLVQFQHLRERATRHRERHIDRLSRQEGAKQLLQSVAQLAKKIETRASATDANVHQLVLMAVELEVAANAIARVDFLLFDTHAVTEPLLVAEASARALLDLMRSEARKDSSLAGVHWEAIGDFANSVHTLVTKRADTLHAKNGELLKSLEAG